MDPTRRLIGACQFSNNRRNFFVSLKSTSYFHLCGVVPPFSQSSQYSFIFIHDIPFGPCHEKNKQACAAINDLLYVTIIINSYNIKTSMSTTINPILNKCCIDFHHNFVTIAYMKYVPQLS